MTTNVPLSADDINDILGGLWEQDHWWGKTPERDALKARLKAAKETISERTDEENVVLP